MSYAQSKVLHALEIYCRWRERKTESGRALVALHACKMYTEHVCTYLIWVCSIAARLGPYKQSKMNTVSLKSELT